MSERQRHGFAYEQYVIDTYDLEKAQEYTSVWDARTRDDQTPVSIKTKRLGVMLRWGRFPGMLTGMNRSFLRLGFGNGGKLVSLRSMCSIFREAIGMHSFRTKT